MSHGGLVEFDFVEDGASGHFVATGMTVSTVIGHLNKGQADLASQLFEEVGGSMAEDLIANVRSSSMQTRRNLAEMFAMARDFANAARVHEMDNRWLEAADMWEKAGDHQAAARAHQRSGDTHQAAEAFERGGQFDAALSLYQQSGDVEGHAEVLARQGRLAEAAQAYSQAGNLRGEVEMLRMVPNSDPARVWAVKRLTFLLENYGYQDQAVQLLVDTMQNCPAAQSDNEIPHTLLRLLQELGREENAQRVQAFIEDQKSSQAEAPQAPAQPEHTAEIAADAANPFGVLESGQGGEEITGRDAAYGYLKAIPIFAELDLGDMRSLYRISEELIFPAGSTIIEKGAVGPGLAVIVSGDVNVLINDKIINALGPGAWVGEISLVREAPTSAQVVSASEVRALTIPRDRFRRFLSNHENAALRIFKLFTENLADRVAELSA